MTIKVIDNGTHRLMAVDYGYHVEKDGEDFGQRAYIADTVEQINADILNGIYKVARDDGKPIEQEIPDNIALSELEEVIDNEA